MISIRDAQMSDAQAIARWLTRAFLIEQFFIERDRTSPDGVRELMAKGKFLLAEDEQGLSAPFTWNCAAITATSACSPSTLHASAPAVGHSLLTPRKIFSGCRMQVERPDDRSRPHGT